MSQMLIRDVSLFVEVVGRGQPLVLMHGGPGLDHWSLRPFRRCADQFTLVYYDHRCNGRSTGAPVESMTFENLTADADALRERLGFEHWAVLGHSFGGHVALEYALRYPDRVAHLLLLDTAGEGRWARENAPALLAARGFSNEKTQFVRRFFSGDIEPRDLMLGMIKFGEAYMYRPNLWKLLREMWAERGVRTRPEALIFAGRHLLGGWSVMHRLGEIKAPTLVMAGRDDFLFPPEHQVQLAAGIPNARLHIVERAGHNPHSEQPDEVMRAVRQFFAEAAPAPTHSTAAASA